MIPLYVTILRFPVISHRCIKPEGAGPRAQRCGRASASLGDRGSRRDGQRRGMYVFISRFPVPSLPCSDSLRVRAPLRLHTPRRVQGAHLAGRRTDVLTSLKSPSRAYTRTHISLTQLLSHAHAHSDTHTHTHETDDSTERTAHRTSAAQTPGPACTRP